MNMSFMTSVARSGAGVVLTTLLLMATGCATPLRVGVTDDRRTQIASAKTISALSQQEIGTSINAADSHGQFGLVGTVIDAAVNNSQVKTVEASVVPVRNALIGYDPGLALGARLTRELGPLKWLKGNSVEVVQLGDSSPAAVADLVKKSDKDAVLLALCEYRLVPSFRTIVMTAKVSLRPRPAPRSADGAAQAEDAPPDVLYFNQITASVTLPPKAKLTRDQAAKQWAENDGRRARRALDVAIAELARMIAFDLDQQPSKSYDPPEGAKKMKVLGKDELKTHIVTGYVVRQENGRSWVRLRSGELKSVGHLAEQLPAESAGTAASAQVEAGTVDEPTTAE
jgi:hypothetical protein